MPKAVNVNLLKSHLYLAPETIDGVHTLETIKRQKPALVYGLSNIVLNLPLRINAYHLTTHCILQRRIQGSEPAPSPFLSVPLVLNSRKTFDTAKYGESNFTTSIWRSDAKRVSASPPWPLNPLTRGSAPGPLAAPPQYPRYRLRHSASLSLILGSALVTRALVCWAVMLLVVTFTCPGVLQCVIYYGGVYMATNNASIFVLPRPSRVTIHPRAVTSERYVTHVITCTAHFPPVTSDVTTIVEWFAADPTVGKWEDVSENKLTIKPGVESSGTNSCSWEHDIKMMHSCSIHSSLLIMLTCRPTAS